MNTFTIELKTSNDRSVIIVKDEIGRLYMLPFRLSEGKKKLGKELMRFGEDLQK